MAKKSDMTAAETLFYFVREHEFLRNTYPSLFVREGVPFATVDHAYQYAKLVNDKDRRAFRSTCGKDTWRAWKFGQTHLMRDDWETVTDSGLLYKDNVMLDCLRLKFAIPIFRYHFLLTGDAELHWNIMDEPYWGRVSCGCRIGQGRDRLGDLLTLVRAECVAANASVEAA